MRIEFKKMVERIGRFVLGKADQTRLALTCLLAGGHLLIEDIPGIGKTTLAKVLAKALGLAFRRVQFTSDMLPGDILGTSVFDQSSGSFQFHPGPIFTQVLLADEINRTTPKTQSALLEAMEEGQVTLDGMTRPLEKPFFVIATQNPLEQSGTYPLPESQLDRFLMRITLGYPARDAEKQLLRNGGVQARLAEMDAVLQAADVAALQGRVAGVHTSEALLDYIQDLTAFTRTAPHFLVGLSPRAGLALARAAQAWAFIDGRDHVVPEDVQAVLPWVTGHRLRSADTFAEMDNQRLMDLLLQVPIP